MYAWSRKNTIIMLSLYLSSIIIGAGVLTLPYQALNVGLIVLLLIIIFFALIFYYIYRKILNDIFRMLLSDIAFKVNIKSLGYFIILGKDISESMQSRFIKERISSSGQSIYYDLLNKSIKVSIVKKIPIIGENWVDISFYLGILTYILFADVGYLIAGSKTLESFSSLIYNLLLISHYYSPLIVSALLVIFLTVIFLIISRKSSISAPIQVLCLFILLIGCSIFLYTTLLFIGIQIDKLFLLMYYLIIIILVNYYVDRLHKREIKEGPKLTILDLALNSEKIKHEHLFQILIFISEVTLISVAFLISLIAILPKYMNSGIILPDFNTLSMSNIVTTCGVVIFSYVGTGVFNILVYDWIFKEINHIHETEKKKKNRKSLLFENICLYGTMIPMLIYLMWSFVAVLIPTDMLRFADANRKLSIDPLAMQIDLYAEPFISTFYKFIFLISGYAFALFAVTMAANGFTETLSEHTYIIVGKIGKRFREGHKLFIKIVIFVIAFLIALSEELFNLRGLTDILGLSGAVGGGIFLLLYTPLLKTTFNDTSPKADFERKSKGILISFIFYVFILIYILISLSEKIIHISTMNLDLRGLFVLFLPFMVAIVSLTMVSVVILELIAKEIKRFLLHKRTQ